MMWPFNRARTPRPERVEPVVDEGAVRNAGDSDSWDVLRGIFEPVQNSAGQVVNEKTSMRVSAVYSCVRLLAGAVASLPIHCYERQQDGSRIQVDHPYLEFLNSQPTPSWSSAAWWEFVVIQFLLRGDSLGYIQRSRNGEVEGIMPLKRSQVAIKEMIPSNPRRSHRLRYLVSTDAGTFGADQDDILHFPNFGFNGVKAPSTIELGANTGIGIAIGADDHAGNFFSQGTKIDHVIKAAGKMGEAQQEAFLKAWRRKYGNKASADIPLILTEGLDIQELTMTAKDAQLLESRQWQVTDIARAFGVPNHMINQTTGQTSWGSGIEQMGIGFVTYSLQPHMDRIEEELNRKLFAGTSLFVEFNPAGLLRGDNKGRADYYKAGLGGTQNPGWMTQNEVRRLENLPPVDGGDRLYAPENDDESTEPPETDE